MTALDQISVETIQAGQPDWRAAQIAEALAAFHAQEVPSGAEEEWRYVELDFDLDVLTLAADPGSDGRPSSDRADGAAGRVRSSTAASSTWHWSRQITVALAEVDRSRPPRPSTGQFAAAHLIRHRRAVVPSGPAVVEAPIVVDVKRRRQGPSPFPISSSRQCSGRSDRRYRSPEGLEAVVPTSSSPPRTAPSPLPFRDGPRPRQASPTSGPSRRDATGRIGEVGLGGRSPAWT